MWANVPFKKATDSRRNAGFTLVELLVVIVVIVILAAVSIVAYKGITARAQVATVQSDLAGAADQLGTAFAQGNKSKYPQSNAISLTATTGDTLTYLVSPDGTAYCVGASGWGVKYYITNTDKHPKSGVCDSPAGATPSSYLVTTFIGTAGTSGTTNGTGTAARLNNPNGLAFDSSGNLYIADSDNNCIRKATPSANVTTFVGSCGSSSGHVSATGTSARFNDPFGLVFDTSDNLFMTDDHDCIRKVTPAAVVTDIAGSCNGGVGGSDGNGLEAQFYDPAYLTRDASGNFYIADSNNNAIRALTVHGDTSYIAGRTADRGATNGSGDIASFSGPYGVAVDSSGTLYIADSGSDCVRKITQVTTSPLVSTLAGACGSSGTADGGGTAAKFNYPVALAFDSSGALIVADADNNCIRRVTLGGDVSTIAGLCGSDAGSTDGTGSTARFYEPYGVAVDASGTIYVSDAGDTIRKITPQYNN